MNIEIEWTMRARAELLALLEARADSTEDALRYAGLFLDDIADELVVHEGEPTDAVPANRPGGPASVASGGGRSR